MVNKIGPVHCQTDYTFGEEQKCARTPVPAIASASVQYSANDRRMNESSLVLGFTNMQSTGIPVPTLVLRIFLLETLPL